MKLSSDQEKLDLIALINSGKIKRIGFTKVYYPRGLIAEWGWFDLSEGDSEPKWIGDSLQLAVWFKKWAWIQEADILESRSFEDRDHTLVKIHTTIKFADIDYVSINDKRIYINHDS